MNDDKLNTNLAASHEGFTEQSLLTDQTGNTIDCQASFTNSRDLLFTKNNSHTPCVPMFKQRPTFTRKWPMDFSGNAVTILNSIAPNSYYEILKEHSIIVIIIHSKYFPVSDWLNPHA